MSRNVNTSIDTCRDRQMSRQIDKTVSNGEKCDVANGRWSRGTRQSNLRDFDSLPKNEDWTLREIMLHGPVE